MLKVSNDMEEIIKEDRAIVYFSAEWCGPCKQLKPQYVKASLSDPDTSYYVVDVDQIGSEYLKKYSIQSIPQIFEMNNGVIIKKIEGKTSEAILTETGKNE